MKKVFLLVLITFILSCTSNEKKESNTDLEFPALFSLNQTDVFFGQISDITVFQGHLVVISEKPVAIHVFDKKSGKYQKTISKQGGEFELMKPDLVGVGNNLLYIWDADLLKFVVFDKDLNPIRSFNNFNSAISDFAIWNNKIVMSSDANLEFSYIIYHLDKEKIVDKFGKPETEQLLINKFKNAGTILSDKFLYLVPSNKLLITKLNDSFQNEGRAIIEDDFNNDPLSDKNRQVFDYSHTESLDFILKSSIVKHFLPHKNSFVLIAEVGDYLRKENKIETNDRAIKFYVFDDKNLEELYSRKVSIDGLQNAIFFHDNEKLMMVNNNSSNDEFTIYEVVL